MPRRSRLSGPIARALRRERRPGRAPLPFGFLQLLCACACALCPSPTPVISALAQVDNVQLPSSPVAPSLVQPGARRARVSFSLLRKVSAGARCLDGSPPGYYYRRGHGTGQRNWLIFLPVSGARGDCGDGERGLAGEWWRRGACGREKGRVGGFGRTGIRACGTLRRGVLRKNEAWRGRSECSGTSEHGRELIDANHSKPACFGPTITVAPALPCLACHPSLSSSFPVPHLFLPLAHHCHPHQLFPGSPSSPFLGRRVVLFGALVSQAREHAAGELLAVAAPVAPRLQHPASLSRCIAVPLSGPQRETNGSDSHPLVRPSTVCPPTLRPRQLKRLTGYGMDGMLHGSAAVNPRFFNWHVVLIAYCDGAAFSGTRGRFNATRSSSLVAGGRSILKSVIRHMRVARGMQGAQRVVVAGCSAGAQAVAMQCDALARLLPTAAAKRCIMDGGFFPDMRDVSGTFFMRKVAQRLVAIHNMSADPDCLRGEGPDGRWRCFFPEHGLRYAMTPLLLVNSVNDADAINLLNLHSPTRRRLRRCLASMAGGGSSKQCAKADVGMALAYAIRVAGLARQVAQQNAAVKPFLYRERMHCATLENRWSTVQGDGGALRDVLGSWALR
ncbi:unnamed protein product [Closterium sp. NIES-64]|nr:unnamed protein product [Closterium sp. NIES-64]